MSGRISECNSASRSLGSVKDGKLRADESLWKEAASVEVWVQVLWVSSASSQVKPSSWALLPNNSQSLLRK